MHNPSAPPRPDEHSAARHTHAWTVPEFKRVLSATVLIALGNWMERIVVGWYVLDQSGSIFLTAASFAARQAPAVFAAPIAGVLADRVSRSRMLGITALFKGGTLIALWAVIAPGDLPVWPVFIIVAFSGIGQSFEIPATQGLVTDAVPRRLRMNAIATQSIGARAVGALGGLAGGVVSEQFGVASALLAGVGVFALGAFATTLIRLPTRRPSAQVSRQATNRHSGLEPESRTKPDRQAKGATGRGARLNVFADAIDGLRLLFAIPVVRTLLIVAVVVEVFGFAYGAVLPAMARDALGVEAAGLGALTMMAGFGGLTGVGVLALLGDFQRKGLLLIGVAVLYGVFLIAFALSGLFPLSLALMFGVGMMAGSFDAMQWTLLQQNVPDDMRGRAIGGWVFAISFGWVGHLALGAVAEWVGVQWALGVAGAVVVVTGLVVWRVAPLLRRT